MPVSMMLTNPYHGINAHLHSFAQNPSSGHPAIWASFHTHDRGITLDYALPPRNFDSYSKRDQDTILQVMQRVQQSEKAE